MECWIVGMMEEWMDVNKNNAAGEWSPAAQKRFLSRRLLRNDNFTVV